METYIFLTGRIEPGQEIQWNIPPMPAQDEPVDEHAAADAAFDAPCTISFFDHLVGCCADIEPVDGDLQRAIEEGEMTAELVDWMEDVEWMRNGC